MNADRRREIVIEYEKVQTIRKRARTRFLDCRGCKTETDLVSIADAAELFETDSERLLGFIRLKGCHYEIDGDSDILLCVASLLETMRKHNDIGRLTA